MTVICPHSCVVCSPKIKLRGKRVSFFLERTKSELHRQCIYISNTLYTHVGPLILLRSLCLHVSLPFLVSFAFAQPLSLTLSLRCSAVCFSVKVSVFVCVCVCDCTSKSDIWWLSELITQASYNCSWHTSSRKCAQLHADTHKAEHDSTH